MPTATVNGVSTYYEIHGDGPPALYIHGGFGGNRGGGAEAGASAIEALDGVATVVIYHRRNTGNSAYSKSHFSLPDLAADARALLDSLGISRSVIIGDSMGGMVALQYALDYQSSVRALALIETGPALMASTGFGPPMTRVVERAKELGDFALFESRKDQLRNPPEISGIAGMVSREERLEKLGRLSDEELFELSTGSIRNSEAFVGYDFTDRLDDLRIPVAIIHGDADPVVPFENARILDSGIRNAELSQIDGAMHGLLAEEKARIALRNWVKRVGPVN